MLADIHVHKHVAYHPVQPCLYNRVGPVQNDRGRSGHTGTRSLHTLRWTFENCGKRRAHRNPIAISTWNWSISCPQADILARQVRNVWVWCKSGERLLIGHGYNYQAAVSISNQHTQILINNGYYLALVTVCTKSCRATMSIQGEWKRSKNGHVVYIYNLWMAPWRDYLDI